MEQAFSFSGLTLTGMQALATQLASQLQLCDVLLLRGDLGVGKTSFTRFLLAALGVDGEIPSPTFTLAQFYETPALSIYHFDLYRLKTAQEIEELGFDEACADGLVLVEWPEKAENYMPRSALSLQFDIQSDDLRCVRFHGDANWKTRLEGLSDAH